ncbi:hypothetical protein FQS87_08145 [Enterococcus avium]|uniref:hypothetical protein n=1 Tax=Enterococcus TaxID=1350 RepID=UPI001A95CDC7|nr:hypothetical protein [Enterococcus avium]MBO1139865.1 hypothetical protein [Enterococcus avium]
MKLESLEDIQRWSLDNLVTRQEAAAITGQSYTAFSQAINLRNIIPFLSYGSGTATVRLYLKEDIENYAKQLKEKKQRRK